jgi:predicted transcriptional regulator
MALVQIDNPRVVHDKLKGLAPLLRVPVTALAARAVAEFVEREQHHLRELGALAEATNEGAART